MQPQASGVGSPSNYGGSLPNMNESNNYANGTMSVAGYAMGTMGVDDDPWAWTKAQSMSAPLAAEIKPSNEQPGGRVADPVQQQLGSMAMNKGIDATATGLSEGYKAYNAAGPLATSQLASADMALGGLGGTAGAKKDEKESTTIVFVPDVIISTSIAVPGSINQPDAGEEVATEKLTFRPPTD